MDNAEGGRATDVAEGKGEGREKEEMGKREKEVEEAEETGREKEAEGKGKGREMGREMGREKGREKEAEEKGREKGEKSYRLGKGTGRSDSIRVWLDHRLRMHRSVRKKTEHCCMEAAE